MNSVLSRVTQTGTRQSPKTEKPPGLPADLLGNVELLVNWCVGVVQPLLDGRLSVCTSGARLRAKTATSCLLQPHAGDTVACLKIAPDEVWIMSILQREEGVANVLLCEGDTTLKVGNGKLLMNAAELELASDRLKVVTHNAQIVAENTELVGKKLQVIATTTKIVGSVLSTVMNSVNHFSKHYLRTTEGVDRVTATHIECEAKQLMRLDGEHTIVTGAKLVKARGAQIHFG